MESRHWYEYSWYIHSLRQPVTLESGNSSKTLTSCFFHLWELAQGTRKGLLRSSYLVIRMRHVHPVQYTQSWVLTQDHSQKGAARKWKMEERKDMISEFPAEGQGWYLEHKGELSL